jgi:hypothetical protein
MKLWQQGKESLQGHDQERDCTSLSLVRLTRTICSGSPHLLIRPPLPEAHCTAIREPPLFIIGDVHSIRPGQRIKQQFPSTLLVFFDPKLLSSSSNFVHRWPIVVQGFPCCPLHEGKTSRSFFTMGVSGHNTWCATLSDPNCSSPVSSYNFS